MKIPLALILVPALTMLLWHCAPPPSAPSAPVKQGIPDWLFTALQKHLDNPSVLTREDISYASVWLKKGNHPQVVANARIDRLNGVLALYEYTGKAYREVYVKKEPVYEVALYGTQRQVLSFVSGFGGTGVQNNFFHVLVYTGNSYTEIWSGVAEADLFTGPLPYTATSGTLHFDVSGAGIQYTQTTRRYHRYEFDPDQPDSVHVQSWQYRLHPETLVLQDSVKIL